MQKYDVYVIVWMKHFGGEIFINFLSYDLNYLGYHDSAPAVLKIFFFSAS
jgi:hypothetical protein